MMLRGCGYVAGAASAVGPDSRMKDACAYLPLLHTCMYRQRRAALATRSVSACTLLELS